MKSFTYKVNDPQGIHARPAGQLIKLYKDFTSDIKIRCGAKEIDGKRLIALMGLQVKQGDTVEFTLNGPDEAKDAAQIQDFLQKNL